MPVEVSQCAHQSQASLPESFLFTAARSSGSAPGKFQRVKFQIEPPRLIHQAVAEFAVAQNQSAAR